MFGTRLKSLRLSHKLSQDELANNLNKKYTKNISKSMISRWENNKTDPQMAYVRIIADYFEVSPSQLLNESSSSDDAILFNSTRNRTMTAIRRVPILGTIACGDPITAEENIEGYLDEPEDSLPNGTVFYLKAKGASMEPTIPDGSDVLIREQPDVEDDEIAAVLVNNDTEATLKRIKRQGKTALLMPDNNDYDPIIITKDNPARILGKAIRFITKL